MSARASDDEAPDDFEPEFDLAKSNFGVRYRDTVGKPEEKPEQAPVEMDVAAFQELGDNDDIMLPGTDH